MSTVIDIKIVRGALSPDGAKHYFYEIHTTKPIENIEAAKEAFSAVIESDFKGIPNTEIENDTNDI